MLSSTSAIDIIKNGCYSTSPDYVEKLCSIIERWNLTQYDNTQTSAAEVWYRVRKSCKDATSQKGAFHSLENAKACADENVGDCVFDEKGKVLYPQDKSFIPYLVKISISDLNIRKGPGTDYESEGNIPVGTYTIVEESDGRGASKWGRLKSSAGWIALDYTIKC